MRAQALLSVMLLPRLCYAMPLTLMPTPDDAAVYCAYAFFYANILFTPFFPLIRY